MTSKDLLKPTILLVLKTTVCKENERDKDEPIVFHLGSKKKPPKINNLLSQKFYNNNCVVFTTTTKIEMLEEQNPREQFSIFKTKIRLII